jgi:hypothetical protein
VANKPEIIIRNKGDQTCLLIDVAIPLVRNVIQKRRLKGMPNIKI